MTRPNPNTVNKHLRIPRDLDDWLQRVSEERGYSVNKIINQAITAYLNYLDPPEADPTPLSPPPPIP